MPKRSNQFQRLVALIHGRLQKEWSVSESFLMTDLLTGEKREVDVVATLSVGQHELYLSIECRDHERVADVTWVESMAKKHEALPTSKLVLWSRSGFTKAARTKAKLLKIDVVSQAEATKLDWTTLARTARNAMVKVVSPTFIPFIDVALHEGSLHRLEDVATSEWRDADGKFAGSIPAVLRYVQRAQVTQDLLLDHAPNGAGDFYFEITTTVPWFIECPGLGIATIRRIGISVKTRAETGAVTAASALTDGQVITLATAPLQVGQFELLAEESKDGTRKTNARIIGKAWANRSLNRTRYGQAT